jgi:hypothetical protein
MTAVEGQAKPAYIGPNKVTRTHFRLYVLLLTAAWQRQSCEGPRLYWMTTLPTLADATGARIERAAAVFIVISTLRREQMPMIAAGKAKRYPCCVADLSRSGCWAKHGTQICSCCQLPVNTWGHGNCKVR